MTQRALRLAKPALLLTVILGLAACGTVRSIGNLPILDGIRDTVTRGENPRDAGLPFDARLTDGDDPRDFVVTVRAPNVTLTEARESARFPATRHCLDLTGFSSAFWTLDPETNDWATSRDERGHLLVSGRCSGR